MRIIEDTKLDFSDVLIVPKRSSLTSRKEVSLEREFTFLNSNQLYKGTPIIASNMDQTGTIEMADALDKFNIATALHKHYSKKDLITYFTQSENLDTFYSMGISDDDYKKFKNVYTNTDKQIRYLSVDVANGYTKQFEQFIFKMRKEFPDITIMAGSVVTPEMTEQLLNAGADIIRIGIGSGSVCITRKVAGVGYGQLSAIIESADAAHGLKGLVCSDGGCQMPGDVAKAFGAGADFVMLGGMFAGHEECNGEVVGGSAKLKPISNMPTVFNKDWARYEIYDYNDKIITTITDDVYNTMRILCSINKDGGTKCHHPLVKKYPMLFSIDYTDTKMKFYGMSSKTAMEKYSGGVAEYRASEGKEVLIPYRGKVENTVQEILGGVRSCCTYVGAKKLKELSKRTTFIKINNQYNRIFGDEK